MSLLIAERNPKVNSGLLQRGFIMDSSLQLYLPLWHRGLTTSPFISRDKNSLSCAVAGTTWGTQGRTFGYTHLIDLRVGGVPPAVLNFANGVAWSLEGWFKHPSTCNGIHNFLTGQDSYVGIVFRYASTTCYKFRSEPGTYYTFLADASGYDEVWTHLTWVCNGTIITLYINNLAGIDITPDTTALEMPFLGATVGTGTYGYEGVIGEVRVYSRVLTTEERQHNRLGTMWRYQ